MLPELRPPTQFIFPLASLPRPPPAIGSWRQPGRVLTWIFHTSVAQTSSLHRARLGGRDRRANGLPVGNRRYDGAPAPLGTMKSLFQNPVAAEVTRLKFHELHGIWSLLTSAATVLKEPPKITIKSRTAPSVARRVHLDSVRAIARKNVARASTPAGLSGVPPRECNFAAGRSGNRSRGRLHCKNRVKMHPPGRAGIGAGGITA